MSDSIQTEQLLRAMFKSEDKDDWKDRDAWRRRALGWKLLCLCAVTGNAAKDPMFLKIMNEAKKADQFRAPSEKEIGVVANFAEKFINKKKFESDIVIARG